MAGEAAIILKDVSFSYGSSMVLENVNLSIGKHEFVSIVGPNGGGKSTLLKLMLGLLNPTQGEISVFGGKAANARRRIGYMPQHLQFDPQFPITALEVVLLARLGQRRLGFYGRGDRRAALEALSKVGLQDHGGKSYADLSGGQRQRVLIARALACEPELLLLDEPTAGVDLNVERMLMELLADLQGRMTVVIVSHDLDFVSGFVKSVICVNRRVVRHPTAAISAEAIKELYKGDMRIVQHGRIYKNGE